MENQNHTRKNHNDSKHIHTKQNNQINKQTNKQTNKQKHNNKKTIFTINILDYHVEKQ